MTNTINISERMQHYKIPGLSIASFHNGRIETQEFGVLEVGTNRKVDKQSIFSSCSISKLVASLIVLKLTRQGNLSLDENINNILTSWKVPPSDFTTRKHVTLRNLLSHQSGFIDPAGSFSEYTETLGIPSMIDLLEGKTPYCKKSIQVTYEPESEFHYSDINFCMIQQIIEDVTGQSFEKIVQDLIFDPLHMKNSYFPFHNLKGNYNNFACGHDKKGHVINEKYPFYPYAAAAGIWTTPSDLASVVLEIINSLKGKSNLGYSEKLMREMITPQGCSPWTGLGVFLDNSNDNLEISSFGWGIGFQCMIVFYPHKETGVIIMTNADTGVHQIKGIIGEIIEAAFPLTK
ncbi:penicillin-binding protein [Bacillus manliponensis]|uniref:Penicillin-binding protein n=2 Tax=Bacillus manliponensis TaxID=574376 RepID=A0A073JWP9_9BACI|nr:penicillin-binding protein [Bacillus manliponensis]